MLSQPLPDLTSALRLQSQSQTLRVGIEQAAQEVTTGLSANIRGATRGDLAPVFSIDREIDRIEVARQDLSLAAARSAVAQNALSTISESAGTLGLDLIGAASRGDAISRDSFIAQAPKALRSMMSALNTQFGGRSLFSGAAEDTAALASSDILITEISSLIGAAASPADAFTAVDTYFGPGGGFENNIYSGATIDAAGVELSEGDRLSYLPRADDQAIRDALKGAALVAASQSAAFATDPGLFNGFVSQAAEQLRGSSEGLIAMRAELGVAEEQISSAQDATEAERSALNITRNDLVGVDQFDAAARLAEFETQLEALYVVTGRLASLTLTNYIR